MRAEADTLLPDWGPRIWQQAAQHLQQRQAAEAQAQQAETDKKAEQKKTKRLKQKEKGRAERTCCCCYKHNEWVILGYDMAAVGRLRTAHSPSANQDTWGAGITKANDRTTCGAHRQLPRSCQYALRLYQ